MALLILTLPSLYSCTPSIPSLRLTIALYAGFDAKLYCDCNHPVNHAGGYILALQCRLQQTVWAWKAIHKWSRCGLACRLALMHASSSWRASFSCRYVHANWAPVLLHLASMPCQWSNDVVCEHQACSHLYKGPSPSLAKASGAPQELCFSITTVGIWCCPCCNSLVAHKQPMQQSTLHVTVALQSCSCCGFSKAWRRACVSQATMQTSCTVSRTSARSAATTRASSSPMTQPAMRST